MVAPLAAFISADAAAFLPSSHCLLGASGQRQTGVIMRRRDFPPVLQALVPTQESPTGQDDVNVGVEQLVRRGMSRFAEGRVQDSLKDFNTAMERRPSLSPFLWQRGISLYYVGDYAEAAAQFRRDVSVNPSDTEEAIWAFLSESRLYGDSPTTHRQVLVAPMALSGTDKARESLLTINGERRPLLQLVYESLRDGGDSPRLDQLKRIADTQRGGASFYASLYLGLLYEAMGDVGESRRWIVRAAESPYASSGDYMGAVAKVHRMARGWW